MTTTGQIIRWSTAGAVIGVAAVAAVASYEHAYALVRAHGETGWIGPLVPLTVDGLIYASSMVLLDSARREVRVPALARWLLGLGIAATLAANVAHGLGHGPVGAAVAAWPAVALVGSYELFMTIIRGTRNPDGGVSETEPVPVGCIRGGPVAGTGCRGVRRRCGGLPRSLGPGYPLAPARGAAARAAGTRVSVRTR